MAKRKSYGQFCALARALDRVGDRWTLLVVRELLVGPKTYRQLEAALDGISPALLVERLRGLVDDGLAVRNDAPPRSKAVAYRLTEAGAALEPAVSELIRWGARWMTTGPGGDRVDSAWAALALRALLDGAPIAAAPRGTVHVDVAGTWVTVRSRRGRRRVASGRDGAADAVVFGGMADLLAVAAGLAALGDTSATVEGDGALATAALTPRR